MVTPDPVDFNEFAASYKEDLERSIAFSGADPDLFIEIKADEVVGLSSRQLGDPASLTVLDVGCGVGETSRFLKGRFEALHGVDIADESVRRAAEANPWATYATCDPGEPLPFEDGRFDLAYAICVLHHVPPPERERFIAEIRRVVRPGGIAAIFEHNPLNPLTRHAVGNCAFDEDAVLSSLRRTKRLLRDGGLEPVESRYIVFFPRHGKAYRAIERGLRWLPLGAQYYVAARVKA